MMYDFLKRVNKSFLGNFINFVISLMPINLNARVMSWVLYRSLRSEVKAHNLRISSKGPSLIISKSIEPKEIWLSLSHAAYVRDIVYSFDYYFESVAYKVINNVSVVDFSAPKDHHVIGFDLFPIHLPSLAEPISTNIQYLEFAKLKEGDVVIDLGAYAGLSSIMFKEVVGRTGVVIAVEADSKNLVSLKTNIRRYFKKTGNKIELVESAIWSHSNGIIFTSDGNMGSSATEILGDSRGSSVLVPTKTLSDLSSQLELRKVTLVKCDIEGGELAVFKDLAFLEKFRPRIIIESHFVHGELTSAQVMSDLIRANYVVKEVAQSGVEYPLLECIPSR